MATGLQTNLLRAAERRPDHPAVIHGDRVTRYGELASAAGRFAATLRRLGVREGDRVAIAVDGVVTFPIAYYGAAMAGAVAVPLSEDLRPGPLAQTLRHAGARALVIQGRKRALLEEHLEDLPELEAVVTLGPTAAWRAESVTSLTFEEALASDHERRDAGPPSGDAPVAIQYTSGTTGQKKGVVLTHANLMANTASIVEYLALREDDVAGMVLPFHYVYGGSILHTHFAVGGTIALLGSMAFPHRVLEGLAAHRCTGLSGVPSTFARLLSLEGLEERALPALRYLTQAGAAMSPEMTARVRRAFTGAELFVMYGQTEASARLAYLPPRDVERKAGSVGFAIPGVELTVRDRLGARCPPHVVGEVVARGANVTPGYFRDPEATARILRPDGLHTGDLGYTDEEGYLYLVGRRSEMIKSGGHRIAPRAIEEVIETLAPVSECAVVGRPDPTLGEAIVAFVVLREGGRLTDRDVLARCTRDLPRFELPREVRFVSQLPRTENGKLSRRRLAEPLRGDR